MLRLAAVLISLTVIAGCSTHHPYTTPILTSQNPDQVTVSEETGVILIGDYVGTDEAEDNYQAVSVAQDPSQYTADGLDTENLDSDMLYEMGREAIEGKDGEKNEDLGRHYLGLSAELGNVEAKRVLAILDLRAEPSSVDARARLEEAAETSVKAKAHYGMMLANLTQPKLNDITLGQTYLTQAHEMGSHEASYALYQLNKVSAPLKAQEYLKLAAEAGSPHAIKQLAHGATYAPGRAESAKWLRSAAELNDPQAMHDYANGLMIGRYQPALTGYKMNREFEAYYWFAQAAGQGHADAKAEIDNLKGVLVMMGRANVSMDNIGQALGRE